MSTTKGALREECQRLIGGDNSFPLAADKNLRSINHTAFQPRGRSESSIPLFSISEYSTIQFRPYNLIHRDESFV